MAEGEKITVKLRKGSWEVEISASESQLKQAIETVLSSLSATESASSLSSRNESTNDQGTKTCRGLIVELWKERWFSQGRSLATVHEEIARRGYHYDRTAVSHALRDLVMEGILTREGSSRNYQYIQKRPPNKYSDSSSLAEDESVVVSADNTVVADSETDNEDS
jgi:hypothetical protein